MPEIKLRDEKTGQIMSTKAAEKAAVEGVRSAARQVREEAVTEGYDLGDSSFDAALDTDPNERPISRQELRREVQQQPREGAAPKHTARMVKRAEKIGMSAEEIEGYDADTLDDILWRAHDAIQHSRGEFRDIADHRNGQQVESASPPDAAAEPALVAPAAASPAASPKAEFDIAKLVELNVHEDVAKQFKAAVESYVASAVSHALKNDERIGHIETSLKSVGSKVMAREQESHNQRLDRAFKELGQSYEKVVGSGSGLALMEKDKSAFAARDAIIRQAITLAGKNGDLTDHLTAAAQMLYGRVLGIKEVVQDREPKEPAPRRQPAARRTPLDTEDETNEDQALEDHRTQRWNSAGLQRPTSRTSAQQPKGVRRAVQAVREQMDESRNGTPLMSANGVEEDGLPE